MSRLMFAAPSSGSGKTAVTCAFLAALAEKGLSPRAFKCGPDYIDPMFHRKVLGVPSYNLDLFFSPPGVVLSLLSRHMPEDGFAVLEGVMGFYDGVGGVTDRAGSWHLAHVTDTPVVLVVQPKGQSLTLAAQIKGLQAFREQSHLAGLLLNRCSDRLCRTLAPMLERETGLKVFGCLPETDAACFESRHLGLVTAEEIDGLREKIFSLGRTLEETADIDGLIALAASAPKLPPSAPLIPLSPPRAKIAVARDRAFCFYYEDNLELLREIGAELAFFSPLEDVELPSGASGLYLGGGYPELWAAALSKNVSMRRAVCRAVAAGMPTVAECGGFLYLQRELENERGERFPMCGALPGRGFPTGGLRRFGYTELTAREDSLLFCRGQRIPAHEFHYWDCTENGAGLTAQKPSSGREWSCCITGETLYAGFPHLYFYACPEMAQRFVRAAEKFGGIIK
ncbi:MAG: cobyrinate a,c-diamide synthase [Oscillospiraceae bacterium]|nr:cobyrinate a,c-diamide synthase [Oscillospiraceae bacterium]